jgi:hypothetical protein
MLERIVSGGQTGVDQAGWRAAKAVGLATGGWMSRGFLTETGPRPEFAELFGAKETNSADYRLRIEWNARDSDLTIWLGPKGSRGWVATEFACRGLSRSMLVVTPGKGIKPLDVAERIVSRRAKVLNVAGGRESRNPGIGERAESFLVAVFRRVLELPEEPPPTVQGGGWFPEPF